MVANWVDGTGDSHMFGKLNRAESDATLLRSIADSRSITPRILLVFFRRWVLDLEVMCNVMLAMMTT
jgi:hypothetical protein